MVSLIDLKSGKTQLQMIYTDAEEKGVVSYTPLVFDSTGKEYKFESQTVQSSASLRVARATMSPERLPREKMAFLAVRKLTEDSLRLVLAPEAHSALRTSGKQALPYPIVGTPYTFDLIDLEGQRHTSKDYLGKVVLLDFWASWCNPCMVKFPKLKESYSRLQSRGLVIIGLNHDQSLETANKYIQREQLPWPNVLAPTSDADRELWNQAAAIETLPKLLLIDRKGVLRAEVSEPDLLKSLERLVLE